MQYLYSDGDLFYFMNVENYEQIALNEETIGDALKFVKENEMVKVCSYNGNVFAIEPPLFVELEITETEPGFKGDTAQGASKWLIKAVGSSPGPFFSSFEVPRTNESLAYTDLYRGF